MDFGSSPSGDERNGDLLLVGDHGVVDGLMQ